MLHFFWSGYTLSENSYQEYEYSNKEIAKWAEYYLSQKIGFHQASWLSGKVTENPDDILLGHLTWDGRSQGEKVLMGRVLRDWVKDNALSATDNSHPNTYILTPWVPEFPTAWTYNMPHLESQLLAARKIFAICGDFWITETFKKLDDSIQDRVKHKLVRSNMGVAAKAFTKVKQSFNPIGERQLLHISNLADYKGFDVTCDSLRGLDTLLHVASTSLKADPGLLELMVNEEIFVINFIGAINNNDPDFNDWVIETCDFYIHTGRMDAQATVILENCARGLIPLVTPESGFACPDAIYLTLDPTENKQIIEQALNLSEEELLNRSRLVREYVLREHNWQTIFEKIWDGINADLKN